MSGQAFEGAMRAIWSVLADDNGSSRTLAEVCEEAGAALRRGWDSAAPVADDGAPYWVEPAEPPRDNPADFERVSPDPGSGYATIATLRARVAELEAQLAGRRVEALGSAGECVTGDGVKWSVIPCRHPERADYVFVTVGTIKDGDDSNVAGIPVAQLLRACGRASL
jgi:hypothetical protein